MEVAIGQTRRIGGTGAVADTRYSGDGLAVTSSPDGARLNCVFQRLEGRATTEGLWLFSTKDGAVGRPFRAIACAIGRDVMENLPLFGKVEMNDQSVRYVRPELTEVYSVGIDGLRQDFLIKKSPPGTGDVRLELEVDGAKAESISGGAKLVLADGGRNIAYTRLTVMDAKGNRLAAKLAVESPTRLAIVLDDKAACYPVRIDPTFSDANWAPLGSGMNGSVYSLAVSGGNLYAGGQFTMAGGVSATNIAEWNGNSWSALGSGVNGAVYALAV